MLSSNQLSRELETLQLRFTNNNTRINNNGGPDSSTSEVYADDIETEANSYFHKIFSGQLTVDAMIQMLTQFKESPDQRFIFIQFFSAQNILLLPFSLFYATVFFSYYVAIFYYDEGCKRSLALRSLETSLLF